MAAPERTRVAVVGGGPAGMVLGLLLARGGIDVVVLEKHADFLRDFRGDTVHASTLALLDELGLATAFARLPARLLDRAEIQLDAGTARLTNLGASIPGRHRGIALVPQWDFLEMLATAAEAEPCFTLVRSAEAVGLAHDGGRVAGVRWRDHPAGPGEGPGAVRTLAADLVVACDGRGSVLRDHAGLVPRRFGGTMDVWWFRLPRREGDPAGGIGRLSSGSFLIRIDRGDYWQCGYVIPKGADAELRAEGLETFRERIVRLAPELADRLAEGPQSMDDVKLLDVRIERLPRWHRDGLLFLGDAAHPMSPVGGVGINLAIQDAVAAARIVGGRMRREAGPVPEAVLAAVQRRRWWPTALLQGFQRAAYALVVRRALRKGPPRPGARRMPLPLRLLTRFPALQRFPAYFVGIGPRPEHAPDWARRPEPTLAPRWGEAVRHDGGGAPARGASPPSCVGRWIRAPGTPSLPGPYATRWLDSSSTNPGRRALRKCSSRARAGSRGWAAILPERASRVASSRFWSSRTSRMMSRACSRTIAAESARNCRSSFRAFKSMGMKLKVDRWVCLHIARHPLQSI